MLRRFLTDETGATAIEYGLIAAMICVAILGGLTTFASGVSALWGGNNSQITGVLNR